MTKVLGDTDFVDLKMTLRCRARQVETLYTRHNSHFDVNIICVPEYFCQPVKGFVNDSEITGSGSSSPSITPFQGGQSTGYGAPAGTSFCALGKRTCI